MEMVEVTILVKKEVEEMCRYFCEGVQNMVDEDMENRLSHYRKCRELRDNSVRELIAGWDSDEVSIRAWRVPQPITVKSFSEPFTYQYYVEHWDNEEGKRIGAISLFSTEEEARHNLEIHAAKQKSILALKRLLA